MRAPGLVSLFYLVLAAGAAGAEVRTVGVATVLRERPGAAYRATFRVPAGARVRVERTRGGWARVRGVRGTGWIPVQQLERPRRPVDPRRLPVEEGVADETALADADRAPPRTVPQPPAILAEPVPPAAQVASGMIAASPLDPGDPLSGLDEVFDAARQLRGEPRKPPPGRDERRHPPGVPVAYARELAPVMSEPRGGRPVAIVREGAELRVVERTVDGKWLLVEGTHVADRGWIDAALVRDTVPLRDPSQLRVGLGASMGVSAIEQTFRAETDQFLGKFALRSVAAAVRLGALARLQVSDSVELAADGAWRLQAARPGLRILRDDGGNDDLGMTVHTFDVGGRLGARGDAGRGSALYARVGYRYETVAVDAGRQARLPSEIIQGPTFGGGIDVPGLGEHLGVAAEALVMAPAERVQSKGQREGQRSSTLGVGGRVAVRYRLGQSWAVGLGYDLWRLTSTFEGASERLPGTAGAQRTTTTQLFLIGFDAVL